MAGVFELNTAHGLFEKLKRDMQVFYEEPTEDRLVNILFPLYHLREWICPQDYKSFKDKGANERSAEESVHCFLHDMYEYQLVRGLCNSTKHFDANELSGRTGVIHGFAAGYGRVGDSLGVTHFLVDGIEVRDIFLRVFDVYKGYFERNGS